METIKRKAFGYRNAQITGVVIAAIACSMTIALLLAGTAWAISISTTYQSPVAMSSSQLEVTATDSDGDGVYALGLDVVPSSTYESFNGIYLLAPTGCGYCWDEDGCGVPGTCPDDLGYCACYSSPVYCAVKYTIVSSTNCMYGSISGGDGDEKTVSITITGEHPSITITAETAAPSPDDVLSNGSNNLGPNAHGRSRTTTINL